MDQTRFAPSKVPESAGLPLFYGLWTSFAPPAGTTPAGATLFSGTLTGTKNGTNKVFTLTNNGSPLPSAPVQATVWKNFPLVRGVGYTLGPGANQVTFTTAPKANDTLFAEGSF